MKQIGPLLLEAGCSLRDLEHVLWERRFTVVMQCYHWKAYREGAWTMEPAEPAAAQAQRVFDSLAEHEQPDFQT